MKRMRLRSVCYSFCASAFACGLLAAPFPEQVVPIPHGAFRAGISGDIFVVGSINGEVTVFERDPTLNAWGFSSRLQGFSQNGYPRPLAIDQETIVVGELSGVLVFVRTSQGWTLQASLAYDNRQSPPNAVSVSGDTVIIGTRQTQRALIYVRDPNQGTWSLEQELSGSGLFGQSVSVSQDTAVVAAKDVCGGTKEGAIHFYTRQNGQWSPSGSLALVGLECGNDMVRVSGNRAAALLTFFDGGWKWRMQFFRRSAPAAGFSADGVFDVSTTASALLPPFPALAGNVALAGSPDFCPVGDRGDAAGLVNFYTRSSAGWRSSGPYNPRGCTFIDKYAAGIGTDGIRAIVTGFRVAGPPGGVPTSPAAYIYEIGVPVGVVGMEVVQSIQDWRNSVPLVANKETYVRVSVRPGPTANAGAPFEAKLRGFQAGGSEMPDSPLDPLPPGVGFTSEDPITERAFPPGFGGGTLDFHLPPDWCVAGTIELRLEHHVDTPAMCSEPAEPDGEAQDCTIVATFEPMGVPELKIYRGIWFNPTNQINVSLSPAEVIDMIEDLVGPFPIPDVNVVGVASTPAPSHIDPAVDDGLPFNSEFLEQLEVLRILDGCSTGCPTIYYGALKEPIVGGLATAVYCDVAVGDSASIAHEIGHVFGRDHAVHSSVPCFSGLKCGWCGEEGDPGEPDFPYAFVEPNSAKTVAALGPMDPARPEDMIFGLIVKRNSPDVIAASPGSIFELMSYCGITWPSKFTYEALRPDINARFPPPLAPSPIPQFALAPPIELLIVRGSIFPTNNTAVLRPLLTATLPDPGPPPPGNYNVQLINNRGRIVTEIPFQPVRPVIEVPSANRQLLTFRLLIPAERDVTQIVLRSNTTVLATRNASPNPPAVTLTLPNGGGTLAGDPITISWTASDPDGDSLTFSVQYSHDNGVTWTTLTTGETNRSYQASRDSFRGSTAGRMRVLVTDGFHTASDISDGSFAVPNNPPFLLSIGLTNGSFFSGTALIFFRASVYDVEDGKGMQNIAWRSSLNGLLGTGATLVRSARTLSEGTHVITATVTDNGGMTNDASITIEVARFRPLQLRTQGFDDDGHFNLWVLGDTGSRYVLETSSDLGSWSPLRTNTMTSALQRVRDDRPTSQQLFYRAQLLP